MEKSKGKTITLSFGLNPLFVKVRVFAVGGVNVSSHSYKVDLKFLSCCLYFSMRQSKCDMYGCVSVLCRVMAFGRVSAPTVPLWRLLPMGVWRIGSSVLYEA